MGKLGPDIFLVFSCEICKEFGELLFFTIFVFWLVSLFVIRVLDGILVCYSCFGMVSLFVSRVLDGILVCYSCFWMVSLFVIRVLDGILVCYSCFEWYLCLLNSKLLCADFRVKSH